MITNLSNQKFGRLTVVPNSDKRVPSRHTKWLCSCQCGNSVEIRHDSLIHGKTKSCGCLRVYKSGKEAAHYIHGGSPAGKKDRLYITWLNMRQRVNDPNIPNFHRYGGRGIQVCPEWTDYTVFRAWAVANGYADNLTIDRIDNDGNYKPSNCQWLTRAENAKKGRN